MDGMNERCDDKKHSIQAGKTIRPGPVFLVFICMTHEQDLMSSLNGDYSSGRET